MQRRIGHVEQLLKLGHKRPHHRVGHAVFLRGACRITVAENHRQFQRINAQAFAHAPERLLQRGKRGVQEIKDILQRGLGKLWLFLLFLVFFLGRLLFLGLFFGLLFVLFLGIDGQLDRAGAHLRRQRVAEADDCADAQERQKQQQKQDHTDDFQDNQATTSLSIVILLFFHSVRRVHIAWIDDRAVFIDAQLAFRLQTRHFRQLIQRA